ncbi:MAG: hypothetical protein QOG58_3372, partial [Caballeronia sp.]|nr:hypothetical protein [Caballeronia sp.]
VEPHPTLADKKLPDVESRRRKVQLFSRTGIAKIARNSFERL